MKPASLAVVILNWNGQNFLEKFLPAVIRHSGSHRIILADNASTDQSVAVVREQFPQVEIVINEENGGFAKGYNDALKRITADYYLLLNSDVEVTENWLEPLLEAMNDPKVAGCQPKIKAYDRKNDFEHAGAAGGFIDKYFFPFCRGRIFDAIETDTGQYDYPTDIFWATGACMLIRSEIYWKAGGLDERFFAHMEEIDLCWRAQRMGYIFRAIPESVVYHVGGGTLNYQSPRKTFLNFRNSLLMIHKNYEGLLFWLLFRRMLLDGIAAIAFLLKGQFPHFKAVFMAHMSFYRLMPSTRKERKQYAHLIGEAKVGKYRGSILYAKYIQGVKSFSRLNQRLLEND
jgi:GT2 family glycosyltransferase